MESYSLYSRPLNNPFHDSCEDPRGLTETERKDLELIDFSFPMKFEPFLVRFVDSHMEVSNVRSIEAAQPPNLIDRQID